MLKHLIEEDVIPSRLLSDLMMLAKFVVMPQCLEPGPNPQKTIVVPQRLHDLAIL